MNYGTSSGLKTVSAQVTSMPGALLGADITPPTSGSNQLVIWDSENNTTAGKLILAELFVDAGCNGLNHEFFIPIAVNRGIYCELKGSGTDPHFYVRYLAG